MSPARTVVAAAGIALVGYAALRLLGRRAGMPAGVFVTTFARTARDAARQRETDLREALGALDEGAPASPRPAARANGAPAHDSGAPQAAGRADGQALTAVQAQAIVVDPVGWGLPGR